MNMDAFLPLAGEQPLDRLVTDGGFCGIFRTIGCVGDSLSSGEFEAINEQGEKTYHDMYEYSWGQVLARMAGNKVYNFSRGGMTAQEYCESFAEANGFWNSDQACQAYILALGVNDLFYRGFAVGSAADIDPADWRNNRPTFAGWFGQIIQRLKEIQPDAKFFLMTMPRDRRGETCDKLGDDHAALMYALAQQFSNTYVLDLRRFAPEYDDAFKQRFYLGGHMNPMGYMLTGRMVASYLDYIIRHHPQDFKQLGFMGTPFSNPEG